MKMDKKALVFTLDAFVATLLFIAVLSYLVFSYRERAINPHMEDMASDIVTLLDYNDTFSASAPAIEDALNQTLPAGYKMQVNLTKNMGSVVSTSLKMPVNKDVACGRRVVAISSAGSITDFGILRYCIWMG